MQFIRRIFGALCICLGALGLLLSILLLSHGVMECWEQGIIEPFIRIFLFLALTVLTSAVVLLLGVRLLKKTRRSDPLPLSFAEQERMKERERLSYGEQERQRERDSYTPVSGPCIWKYKKGMSAAKPWSRYRNTFFFGLFALAVILIGLSVFLSSDLPREFHAVMLCILVFGLTGVLATAAFCIGRTTQGMLLSFARDSSGRMYLFDYNLSAFREGCKQHGALFPSFGLPVLDYFLSNRQTAKLIEFVDGSQILEKIMASGEISPYGQEIISVDKIREGPSSARTFCTLVGEKGTIYGRSIVIPASYDSYEALLDALRRLEGKDL
jgi:hypothetical protein